MSEVDETGIMQLFDTTPFKIQKDAVKDPVKLPERVLVVYANTKKKYQVKEYITLEEAESFCRINFPQRMCAVRIIHSKDIFVK
jgi:hypothetical protein